MKKKDKEYQTTCLDNDYEKAVSNNCINHINYDYRKAVKERDYQTRTAPGR